MYLKCECGNVLTDTASSNGVEHILLGYSNVERLQNQVDQEVSTNGTVDSWPEHWEEAGGIEVWKCSDCGRLYLNPRGETEDIFVYKLEKKGLGVAMEEDKQDKVGQALAVHSLSDGQGVS